MSDFEPDKVREMIENPFWRHLVSFLGVLSVIGASMWFLVKPRAETFIQQVVKTEITSIEGDVKSIEDEVRQVKKDVRTNSDILIRNETKLENLTKSVDRLTGVLLRDKFHK